MTSGRMTGERLSEVSHVAPVSGALGAIASAPRVSVLVPA
jgi:hypothetical protein